MRPVVGNRCAHKRVFQFTHPGRGATLEHRILERLTEEVSIHAPREGCDGESLPELTIGEEFQFTHPGRGATHPYPSPLRLADVSIHAPREGCDYYPSHPIGVQSVSIHAPREGCDLPEYRQAMSNLVVSIHAPREGCDFVYYRHTLAIINVSIHAPREGCDYYVFRRGAS